jgi:hypothetical protein
MSDFPVSFDLDQVRADAAKARTEKADAFFDGRTQTLEEVHRRMMLQAAAAQAAGIKEFARMHGMQPEDVLVKSSVNGFDTASVYDIKP